jgi:hypothetical protein
MRDATFAHDVARELYWDAFRQGEMVFYPMTEEAVSRREKSIENATRRILRRLDSVRAMAK